MRIPSHRGARVAMLLMALAFAPGVRGAERPDITADLELARLDEAAQKLADYLESQEDPTARFQLGFVQFLQGVEQLGQQGYRHGLSPRRVSFPLLRLDVKPKENPDPIDYRRFRQLIEEFQQQILKAEKTLAQIGEGDIKWTVRLNRIAVDWNEDGQVAEHERLWNMFLHTQPQARQQLRELAPPKLTLDRADVYWLRGYCHTLVSFADMLLAYDTEAFFQHVGHLLFTGAERPYPESMRKHREKENDWLMDIIKSIHLARFEPAEPERMASAHAHMLEVIAMSRKSFEAVLAETDDDHEWIPAPHQTPILPQAGLSREQIEAWHELLDEAEAILKGEKLVPHWRAGPELGVNVKRVFHEPLTFDLVMWADGAGLLPCLEEGPQTSREMWNRFNSLFGGNLIGFSFWIN